MQVSRSLAFDFNRNLTLPRLLNEETKLDMQTLPIVVKEEGSTAVRFQDVYQVANQFDIEVNEAWDYIVQDYDLHSPYTIVSEARLYEDVGYRRAVLESYDYIPMRFQWAGTLQELDSFLNESISLDLEEGTTDRLDSLLEGLVGNLFGLAGVEANDLAAARDNIKGMIRDNIQAPIKQKIGEGIKKLAPAALKGAEGAANMIGAIKGDPNYAEKLGNKIQDKAENAVKYGMDQVAGKVKDNVYAKVRKGVLTVGGVAALATLKNAFDNLTDQERIEKANPGIAAKMMNSLKNLLGKLTGRQQSAPPQQQGLISRMIQKIKDAIKALARKVGIG